MIELCQSRKQRLFCCFLDLEAAYDYVHRPSLWAVLSRLGIHGTMSQGIKALYESPQYAMKINNYVGSARTSYSGLRQGCPLSPTLFGLFLDGLTRYLLHHCPLGCQVTPSLLISHLLYADDTTLVATSAQHLQVLINTALDFSRSVGLPVSAAKTAIVCFPKLPQPFSWSIDGHSVTPVTQTKYLGLDFNEKHGALYSVCCREAKMWRNWAALQRHYTHLQCNIVLTRDALRMLQNTENAANLQSFIILYNYVGLAIV